MSEKMKHTAVPWKARKGNSRDPIAIEDESCNVIVRVERIDGIGGVGPDNARLISAAPELLEALQSLVGDKGVTAPYALQKKIYNAIAKATGAE